MLGSVLVQGSSSPCLGSCFLNLLLSPWHLGAALPFGFLIEEESGWTQVFGPLALLCGCRTFCPVSHPPGSHLPIPSFPSPLPPCIWFGWLPSTLPAATASQLTGPPSPAAGLLTVAHTGSSAMLTLSPVLWGSASHFFLDLPSLQPNIYILLLAGINFHLKLPPLRKEIYIEHLGCKLTTVLVFSGFSLPLHVSLLLMLSQIMTNWVAKSNTNLFSYSPGGSEVQNPSHWAKVTAAQAASLLVALRVCLLAFSRCISCLNLISSAKPFLPYREHSQVGIRTGTPLGSHSYHSKSFLPPLAPLLLVFQSSVFQSSMHVSHLNCFCF